MFNVPVTFIFFKTLAQEAALRSDLAEFAEAGGKNVVLSDGWINGIMGDYRQAKQLEKLVSDYGLNFCDSHAPFGADIDMNIADPVLRRQMILRQKLAIEIAASFGVKTITSHLGSDRHHPEIPLAKHLDLMRESLDELVPFAEKNGIILAIENSMSRAASPDNVVQLKSEYPSEYLGLCYDSGHANQLDNGRFTPGGTIWQFWQMCGVDEPEWDEEILEKMLPEMVNCHLHDNDGSGDSHAIPGEGNVPWAKVIPMLKKAPRLQVIQCEVLLDQSRHSVTELCRKFDELAEL